MGVGTSRAPRRTGSSPASPRIHPNPHTTAIRLLTLQAQLCEHVFIAIVWDLFDVISSLALLRPGMPDLHKIIHTLKTPTLM